MKRNFLKRYEAPKIFVSSIEFDYCLASSSADNEKSNAFAEPVDLKTEFTTQEISKEIDWKDF